MKLVCSNTPWEVYHCGDVPVHVKREDLSCPAPGPSFSKIRGVERHLLNLIDATGKRPIGVLDTLHSKAGWGVAYMCKQLGLPCYNFFPVYKAECGRYGDPDVVDLRENQEHTHDLGAHLMPLDAGMSAVLYHIAKKQLAQVTDDKGYMMPNALKLAESVDATARELTAFTPQSLLRGAWVISASSGTLAAGVVKGLKQSLGRLDDAQIVIHLGYSRPIHSVMDYICDKAGIEPCEGDISIIDEGYAYKDKVVIDIPFPCNEYYDAKAWKWLRSHTKDLITPISFWNIGA